MSTVKINRQDCSMVAHGAAEGWSGRTADRLGVDYITGNTLK